MPEPADEVGRFQHALDDGRIQCDLCPRACRLHDGQRAFCFVRERRGAEIFAEYAIDAAHACRERGVRSVAVTAGYISARARGEYELGAYALSGDACAACGTRIPGRFASEGPGAWGRRRLRVTPS